MLKRPRPDILTSLVLLVCLLIAAALSAPSEARSQEGDKEPGWPVLIELFTTDWTVAGPPMVRALERLAAERGPERVIALEYHLDDEYTSPATEARMAAYRLEQVPRYESIMRFAYGRGGRDEAAVYQDYRRTLLQLAKYYPQTLYVEAEQAIETGKVSLRAKVENRGEREAADLEVVFVLYEDLGREGYHFVVRAISEAQPLAPLAPGTQAELAACLALPEGVDPAQVQSVAILQSAALSGGLRVLAAGTTATSYPFAPPMPEEAAPATGLLQQPQVMDLRTILTRLRPWLAGAAALTALLLLLAAAARPHTFRYALHSLLKRADRTALLLVGVLAASLGVSLLSSVTEATQVQVGRELAVYWRTTYDLLVRPGGSRSPIESRHNLLEAHYESGLAGGITMAQYQAIKALPEVEVAAPVASIGYFDVRTATTTPPLPPRVYRIQRRTLVDAGHRVLVEDEEVYAITLHSSESDSPANHPDMALILEAFGQKSWSPMPKNEPLWLPVGGSYNVLLAAIDPQAEAALVGLDGAVVEGRYFSSEDILEGNKTGYVFPDGQPAVLYEVPVLVNARPLVSTTTQFTVSQIELPVPGVPTMKALEALQEAGGHRYLERTPGRVVYRHTLSAADSHALTFDVLKKRGASFWPDYLLPSPIHYREVLTAPVAADLVLGALPVAQSGQEVDFRHRDFLGMGWADMYSLRPIGTFDLVRLLEGQQLSPNAVPLETYLPPRAVLKYDEDGQPVESAALRPTLNPGGYVTTPPLALAPLELAELLGGPAPISCIRVRVAGIETMNDKARAKIETLAQQIVDLTGLEVDVMVGSSPQPLLVHIPGYGDVPPTGYVKELWVKKNVDTAILQNTQWASFLVLGLALGVCTLYIASVSYLSVLGRQGELGLLKAVGWRTSAVAGLILAEQTLVGGLAGTVGALLALALTHLAGLAIPLEAALLMLPLGVALCLAGGLAPARRAVTMPPAHVVRAGEVRARRPAFGRLSVTGYSFRHLLLRRGRALAAVLMLALATALLAFMGMITLSARHFLQTTLLGQHVALQVQGYHLALALLCALVAALTVADLTLLNARERRREMGLLRAAGWRAGDVVRLFLGEAAWIGLLGGLLGSGLALGGFAALSPTWPGATPWVALGGLALPVLVSAGAAWYPAWVAAGELPVSSLNELPRQRPAVVERRQAAVRLAAGLALIALVVLGLVWWQTQVSPPVVVVAPPVTAEPTAAPTPTATLGPPVEPTSVHPAEAAVESLRAYQVAQTLMAMGEREPGSPAAQEAANYVAEAFASYGLAVEREKVEIPPLASARYVALRVGKIELIPQGTAAHLSALAGEVVTAPLIVVSPHDLPPLGEVEGKIVVVEDRKLSPPTLEDNDEQLPGLAAVLETYPAEALAAAVSLAPADAAIVRQTTAVGERAQLVLEGLRRYEAVSTENIGATLPGTTHPEEEIWLLATRNTEGWDPPNDGGHTNTALLLELARVLGREPLPRTVRFVSLGSERADYYFSSRAYLTRHRDRLGKVLTVLNLDTALGGEAFLFGVQLSGRFDPAATTPAPPVERTLTRKLILIDLDSPEQAAGQWARIRGEDEIPPLWSVETPTWLMREGYALAAELEYQVTTTLLGRSERVFLQAGVPAARIAWGVKEGLFSEEERPLRVERLEQSAALAYALVGRLAEEGRGE